MDETLQSAAVDEDLSGLTLDELFEEPDEDEDTDGPAEADESGSESSPEASAEAPPEAEASNSTEATPEDGNPAETAAPDDTGPTTSETPKQSARPFTFKVDGTEVPVPGAVETDDFVAIPKDAWQNTIRPRLANREEWRRKEADFKRQLESKGAKELQAEKVIESFNKLLKLAGEDQNSALAFLQDFGRQLPLIEKEAKIQELEARVKERDTVDHEAEAEKAAADLRESLERDLKAQIASHVKDPRYAGADPEKAFKRLWKLADKIYFDAKEDIVDDSGAVVVPAGGIGINFNLIREELGDLAEFSRATTTTTKKVERAAETNRKALAPQKAPPPSVPAKGSPAAGGEVKTFKTRDEWEAHMRGLAKVPA